jgi:HEAT repeat protein
MEKLSESRFTARVSDTKGQLSTRAIRRPCSAAIQNKNHVRPLTSANEGVEQLLKAITQGDAVDVPAVKNHFKRVLLPRVLEYLTDRLLDVLKSKLPAKRERAATALAALRTPAVMPIAMRLVRGKNLAYRLRLVELLGELGNTEQASLPPLLRALNTGPANGCVGGFGEDGRGG